LESPVEGSGFAVCGAMSYSHVRSQLKRAQKVLFETTSRIQLS